MERRIVIEILDKGYVLTTEEGLSYETTEAFTTKTQLLEAIKEELDRC